MPIGAVKVHLAKLEEKHVTLIYWYEKVSLTEIFKKVGRDEYYISIWRCHHDREREAIKLGKDSTKPIDKY
mgnify:CR=1 FL=1